jgi:hypothetical protein
MVQQIHTVVQQTVIKTVRKLLATDYDSDLEGIQPFPAHPNFNSVSTYLVVLLHTVRPWYSTQM